MLTDTSLNDGGANMRHSVCDEVQDYTRCMSCIAGYTSADNDKATKVRVHSNS